ncbi:hypothetical protein [Pantoea sp. CCBC3-3-1]|uniref:antirestriction phage head protein DarA n=1 Tax=Pantoea sp. CCBC3-3-1 TaxID=2490851 RepID=UPI0011BF6C68|nr:hypothetical protein [Pantoea sp. CCBC3-3-1]
MLRDIRLQTALVLQNRQDLPLINISDKIMEELRRGKDADFLLEPVNMADVESTYFYDAPLLPEINAAMFEAVTSTRGRLAGTMRAFIRALNTSLNGTGITAGNDTTGSADDSSQSIGGANIGRVRKVQGLAVMPAIIPLSDGQTVTLVFHSPTGNAGTITSADTLVAFQFILNKKDVTHVVSPANGRDISLKQVTTALSNLIERNTVKFQHAQAKQKAVKAEIANMQAEGDKLEEQQADQVSQGDDLKSTIKFNAARLSDLSYQADQQEALNEELQAQLTAAQKKKDDAAATQVSDRNARAGALEIITTKSGYKDTFVANWAYNSNISTADLVALASKLDDVSVSDLKDLIMYKGQLSDLDNIPALKARNTIPAPSDDPDPRTLYWYGLRARPAGPGALPQEPKPVVTATVGEAAAIPLVKAKNFDPSMYRNGAVAYAAPLDAGDVAQYELVDFQKAQTASSITELLNDLVPLIKAYAGNENAFYLDYLADEAPKAADLPQSMKDAGGFQGVRQNYGSKASLQFIDLFKQVKKDNPTQPPADTPPTDTVTPSVSDNGDTVPLSSIQTAAIMPTIAKSATAGDNPIWYTQSTLSDIVASAKFKIDGQFASSNPEFAESRYQMVKAALAAGFGMQRFKISGLQYIYVLRKDDDILTTQGAAKFTPAAVPTVTPPADPVPPAGDATDGSNGYVSVKPSPDVAAKIAKQVSTLGIMGGIDPSKLHVTLMYSKNSAVNAQPEPDRVYQAKISGRYEIIGESPKQALVALLDSPDLQKRFDELSAAGGQHSFPDYKAHISLKYGAEQGDLELIQGKGLDISSIPLSGETFEDIKPTLPSADPVPDAAPPADDNTTPPTASKLIAKAYEVRKDGAEISRGDIMMCIEGPKTFINFAEKTLDKDYSNGGVEEEGGREGDIAVYYGMARGEKATFMQDWKELKAEWAKQSITPSITSGETPLNKPADEPEAKPEADTAAQKAIDYLKQIAKLQTADMVEIRNARGSVREAITTLNDAGAYDENEDLVNAAAQHLSDILAAVARGGAA